MTTVSDSSSLQPDPRLYSVSIESASDVGEVDSSTPLLPSETPPDMSMAESQMKKSSIEKLKDTAMTALKFIGVVAKPVGRVAAVLIGVPFSFVVMPFIEVATHLIGLPLFLSGLKIPYVNNKESGDYQLTLGFLMLMVDIAKDTVDFEVETEDETKKEPQVEKSSRKEGSSKLNNQGGTFEVTREDDDQVKIQDDFFDDREKNPLPLLPENHHVSHRDDEVELDDLN